VKWIGWLCKRVAGVEMRGRAVLNARFQATKRTHLPVQRRSSVKKRNPLKRLLSRKNKPEAQSEFLARTLTPPRSSSNFTAPHPTGRIAIRSFPAPKTNPFGTEPRQAPPTQLASRRIDTKLLQSAPASAGQPIKILKLPKSRRVEQAQFEVPAELIKKLPAFLKQKMSK
jgi:hypothetical protein